MNSREWGIALLCCVIPGSAVMPLSGAQLRHLHRRVLEAGMPDCPTEDVRPKHLEALGYETADAVRICALLNREAALERYLEGARKRGVYLLTRISKEYPQRLREQLGLHAPAVLFASGDAELLNQEAVSIVGSRALLEPGARFACRVGQLAAKEGLVLVSGNAVGADQVGQRACYAAGGSYISFVADELTAHPSANEHRQLMVSEGGYDLPFSTARALRRNHFIHAQGTKSFVAQCAPGYGGTWSGTAEHLRRAGAEVYVNMDNSRAMKLLCERGAQAVREDALLSIRALRPAQTSFL